MKLSRQLLLGTGVFLGGGILLFSMAQNSTNIEMDTTTNNVENTAQMSETGEPSESLTTLTADVETEQRILSKKQLQREAQVAAMDRRTQSFLKEQERAEALAMEKSRRENEMFRANAIEPVMDEPLEADEIVVTTQPEITPIPSINAPADIERLNNESQAASSQANAITTPQRPGQITNQPTVATVIPREPSKEQLAAEARERQAKAQQLKEQQAREQARKQEQNLQAKKAQEEANLKALNDEKQADKNNQDKLNAKNTESKKQSSSAPSKPQQYKVQRADGLIKLAREYNLPVKALSQANNLSTRSTLQLGQTITIPSASQVDRLVRDYDSKHSQSNDTNSRTAANKKAKDQQLKAQKSDKENDNKQSNAAPASPTSYKVKRGDGLIKLARQYNVPVAALAEANNKSTKSSLRVGETLKIPSRRQIARLEREAKQRQQSKQQKREAQKRLADARRKASQGDAKGKFGVQVALADNQKKADEVAKKMRAAGYSVSTSKTSRGVRVIVGPEKGKEAALALKDKINADSRTGVSGAWVLYWR